MKNRILIGSLFAMLSAFSAQAEKVGNGGNAIVCFNHPSIPQQILSKPPHQRVIPNSALSAITFIEALDLYDIKNKGGSLDQMRPEVSFLQISPHETNSAFLERMAVRLETKIPSLAQMIREGAREFSDKTLLTSSQGPAAGVEQVYDIGRMSYALDPERCVLSTIMNQSGMGNDLELSIDARLFNHPLHSELSKKALILHEVIYLAARKQGQETSELTRKVVGELIKSKFSRNKIASRLAWGFLPDGGAAYFESSFKQTILDQMKITAREVKGVYAGKTWDEQNHYYLFDQLVPIENRIYHISERVKLCKALMNAKKLDRHERKWILECPATFEKLAALNAERIQIIAVNQQLEIRFNQAIKDETNKLRQQFKQGLFQQLSQITGHACYSEATEQKFMETITQGVHDFAHRGEEEAYYQQAFKVLPCDDFEI